MCDLVRVVYFSLFFLFVSHDIKDEPHNEKNSHIFKVHRSKATFKNNDISTKVSNNTNNIDLKTETEDVAKLNDHEEFTHKENAGQTEHVLQADISEEGIERTGEVLKPSFNSTNISISTDESRSLSDDSKDEVSKSGYEYSDDEFYDEEPNSAYEDILMHTPLRNTANHNTVLDLKGRRGHGQSQDEEIKTELEDLESNTSKIGRFPQSNVNMRSGYVPPDNDDDVSKLLDIKPMAVNHFKSPNSGNSNIPSLLYHRNNGSPGIPNLPSIPVSRYLPPFSYSDPSSRESMWGQGASPVVHSNTLRSPYFGLAHPNNQVYNAKMGQQCPTCFPETGFSQERTFRRSVETNTYQSANGSLEFDPQGENAYPYTSEDVFLNRNAIQELFKPEPRQVTPQLDPPNHNFQRSGLEGDSEKNPFSNVLKPLQQFFSRSNPILFNRRIGLGGQFVHY